MKKASNKNLTAAKKARNDEFYTRIEDVERELQHYKDHFRGKVVLCNCDDPRKSKFFHYFSYKFEHLGLKKLMATCFRNQEIDQFSRNDNERGICLEYEGDKNKNRVPDLEEIGIRYLKGDGDFRSKECIELLKQAGIVCTNPPFSLFREYIAQLIEYKKKFLVIGPLDATTYKEIFPLIKQNKIWLGCTHPKQFLQPDGSVKKFGNTLWFTNLTHKKRNGRLISTKKYRGNEQNYPKYENYDAIEVSKVVDIPKDYNGVMGVPISFLEKYNPEQFEIMGMCENEDLYKLKTRVYTTAERKEAYFKKFGKKGTYDLNARGVVYRDGLLVAVYQRVLIKHKNKLIRKRGEKSGDRT